MKVIVADKISERGVKLLKEQAGWNVVLTTKDTLTEEIADADALIVRSATKVTAESAGEGAAVASGGARGRWRGQHRPGRGDAARCAGDEHAGRECGQRCGAYVRADAGDGAAGIAARQVDARREVGEGKRGGNRSARQDAGT